MSERPVPSRIRVRSGRGPKPSVDGHPGWVRQSVHQYIALCAAMLFVQALIIGVGPVLMGAYSASWWCTGLGAILGLLFFIPVHGMTCGTTAVSLDEAFREGFGKTIGGALSIYLALMLATDALLTLRALGSLVWQYLLDDYNETILSISALGIIAISVTRHGVKGVSRLLFMLRVGLIGLFVICCLYMLPRAGIDNLFPLLGSEAERTLWQLPVSTAAYSGVLMLGLLPKMTGSATPVPFRSGVLALLIGGLLATVLMLMINLSISARAVPELLVWGRSLMIGAEYMQSRLIRFAYIIFLILALLIAASASIASAGVLLSGSVRGKQSEWAIPVICGLVLIGLFILDSRDPASVLSLYIYKGPAVWAPLCIAWIVLILRRKWKARKEAAA